jgi:hypothetical protein
MTGDARVFRRDRMKRCLEIISELEGSLRRHNLESRGMPQRWERDALHAQWREDNSHLRDVMNDGEPYR